ncbi:ROK family protein [Paracoccus laeviglucosivorans]|uniref:N-acetylglucosamine kinase n=1 Tax=Paracoccus laeviglucosivorans TaxID=1197861 RepID=A0A521B870_9RHOB|nr:ROK family protein [Paracoccus laeviglucosivorans]SMO43279.1 N-acetylglucosamine kinase [Paracoccus laeviglucosivorans]
MRQDGMAGTLCGAIDLGGTKIEARLFDAAMAPLDLHRVATPREDFAAFMVALVGQVRWLEAQAGAANLPVAISIAGLIDPVTGIATASNIPVTGRNLGAELTAALGRPLPMVNDCTAFAWSEAHGGAGDGARSVMGLVMGTGVGAGLVLDGRVPPRHAGISVEIGHLGMPGRALARHGLPLWRCGCGRDGCHENYVSGTGLRRIAEWAGLSDPDPGRVAARAGEDAGAARVMEIWADLAGEMLYAAQLMLDPEVIVLGGGLSNIACLPERLSASLQRLRLGDARLPAIRRAVHGDSSGARGAALMARMGLAC